MIAYSVPVLASLWMASSVIAQSNPVFSQPVPVYTATYIPNYNTPQTSETGQTGTNKCGTGSNQTSNCQNAYLNALDDFCLWAPPQNTSSYGDSSIGNTERLEVAWCLRSGYGTRLMLPGAITGAHWVQTPNYVQITGTGDLTHLNIPKNDQGGELDPHGADGNGNPIGGLVFGTSYGGTLRQYHEWTNFMGASYFCFRACLDKPGATQYCGHIWDTLGCGWNMPGNYSTGFSSCLGDPTEPMGIYVTNGVTSTFYQGEAVTPAAHLPGSTSSCSYYETLSNYNALAPSPTAAYFGGSSTSYLISATSSGGSISAISRSTTSGLSKATGSPTSVSRGGSSPTSSKSSSASSTFALPVGSLTVVIVGVVFGTIHILI